MLILLLAKFVMMNAYMKITKNYINAFINVLENIIIWSKNKETTVPKNAQNNLITFNKINV